jgi:hypothetical protein
MQALEMSLGVLSKGRNSASHIYVDTIYTGRDSTLGRESTGQSRRPSVAHRPSSISHPSISRSSISSTNGAFAPPQSHRISVAGVNPAASRRSFVAPPRALSPGSRSPTGRPHV